MSFQSAAVLSAHAAACRKALSKDTPRPAYTGPDLLQGIVRPDQSASVISRIYPQVDLSSGDFHSVNLAGIKLNHLKFCHSDLRYADLRGADLYRADLRFAYLQGADLTDANLKHTDLRGANLKDAKGILYFGSFGKKKSELYLVTYKDQPYVQYNSFWGPVSEMRTFLNGIRLNDYNASDREYMHKLQQDLLTALAAIEALFTSVEYTL